MAERGRKSGFRMTDETYMRFYVYQFVGNDGSIMYVGKGSGRRLKNQERRFGMAGQIVKRFASENAAYEFERALISRLSPSLNKLAGGGGSIAHRAAKLPTWFRRIQADIASVGSRVYVARELLKLDISGIVTVSQLDIIKRVAQGDLRATNG